MERVGCEWICTRNRFSWKASLPGDYFRKCFMASVFLPQKPICSLSICLSVGLSFCLSVYRRVFHRCGSRPSGGWCDHNKKTLDRVQQTPPSLFLLWHRSTPLDWRWNATGTASKPRIWIIAVAAVQKCIEPHWFLQPLSCSCVASCKLCSSDRVDAKWNNLRRH